MAQLLTIRSKPRTPHHLGLQLQPETFKLKPALGTCFLNFLAQKKPNDQPKQQTLARPTVEMVLTPACSRAFLSAYKITVMGLSGLLTLSKSRLFICNMVPMVGKEFMEAWTLDRSNDQASPKDPRITHSSPAAW